MYPGPKPPGQKSPVPIRNWDHWRSVGEFTLLQAACLWAEIEPLDALQDLRHSPQATARYHMLTRAIEAGDLTATHANPAPRTIRVAADGAHGPDMLVSREDLEALAVSIGERPLFLFEDTIISPGNTTKPVALHRYSEAALNKWYQDRIASWPPAETPPTREADWEDAKQMFPGVTQKAVYACRGKVAPPGWTSKGRRRQPPPA